MLISFKCSNCIISRFAVRYDEIWINNLHTNSRPNIYQCNNIQLLHLNEINMRFYGAEYNNIERGRVQQY